MAIQPRMFDGKKYKHHFIYQGKKEAVKQARILRRSRETGGSGELARVVEMPGLGWAVFYRKK